VVPVPPDADALAALTLRLRFWLSIADSKRVILPPEGCILNTVLALIPVMLVKLREGPMDWAPV